MLSPFNGGDQIDLMEIARTLSLHLVLLWASFKLRPAFKRSFSTCFLHVFFGRPHFLRLSTLNSKAFLTTLPSSFIKTCPNHLTPLALVILSMVRFNPTYPSYLLYFSCPLVRRYTWLSPLLFLFFSKYLFVFSQTSTLKTLAVTFNKIFFSKQ